jgi:uncharacterized protein YbaR (Trm112 family)
MRKQQVNGYVVVSGRYDLPFQSDLFDLLWSYEQCSISEPAELASFASTANSVLAKSGRIKIAVPSHPNSAAKHDTAVGNLSRSQWEKTFREYFSNVTSNIQSCFNTVPAKAKLKNSSWLEKPKLALALAVSFLSKYFSSFNAFADTCFISSQKIKGPQNLRIAHFLRHHWLKQNLNVVYLLQCPMCGGPVYLSKDAKFVISDKAGVKYPVIDEVPIMLKKAAIPAEKKSLNEAEVAGKKG